jgi:Cu-Zn family superoxide dismutase
MEFFMNKPTYYKTLLATALASITMSSIALAGTTVAMNVTAENGVGAPAGTVAISETPYGLLFTPKLHGLTPGAHGFHIHQNPSCDEDGMAAGGHFDPKNTGTHLGPYNDNGHLGDLPILYVNQDGTATLPVLAPRLHHLAEISQHALMVHHAGDNYSDVPDKLGGGGARMVCGVIN